MKKYFILFFLFFPSFVFAAGGEINACIIQENKMINANVIGINHDIAIKNPFFGNKKINIGNLDINTIDNSGKTTGFIVQKNNLNNTDVIASQINTIINKGKTNGYIEQQNDLKNCRIIGTEVNTLINNGDVENVIQKGLMTKTNIIIN